MKKIGIERDRILKVWEYEDGTLMLEVGLKDRWKESSNEIGFFTEKKRLYEELPRYFKDDELEKLKSNKEFLQSIQTLK